MLFLVLDTETSGLTPTQNQIIEIGSLIAELDLLSLKFKIVSKFESLVALRQDLDPKITRLTGITAEDLKQAQNLTSVSESWLHWISPYEKGLVTLLGHSIDFDLAFLKNENWYIPKNLFKVDTLELSRILLPSAQGINLEYLLNFFKIKFESTTGHHRSLFDATATLHLMEKILNWLSNQTLPEVVFKSITHKLLPSQLIIYNKNLINYSAPDGSNLNLSSQTQTTKTVLKDVEYLNIDGSFPIKSLSSKINFLGVRSYQHTLENLLSQSSNYQPLNKALLQLMVLNQALIDDQNAKVRLHTQRGVLDYWIFEILIDDLIEPRLQAEMKLVKTYEVKIEDLIYKSKLLSEKSLNLGQITELLNVLMSFDQIENIFPEFSKICKNVINAHDFLIFSLQPFLRNKFYKINFQNISFQEEQIADKIKNIFIQLNQICVILEKNQNTQLSLVSAISKKICNLINRFDLQYDQEIMVTYKNDSLVFSQTKTEFSLIRHFKSLVQQNPKTKFISYLPQPNLEFFLKLFGLNELNVFGRVSNVDFIDILNLDLNNFLSQKIEISKESKLPVIVLAGQNSTVKDLKKILIENFNPKDFLILGESGSLTKIISKISNGFSGLVVLKMSNLSLLLGSVNSNNIFEIWLINHPYLFVDPQIIANIQSIQPLLEIQKTLRELYLVSQRNYYYLNFNLKINFVKSYF